MKSGGHFGCWTMKAINKFLLNVTGGDAQVEPGRSEGKWGYICKDSYRPGMLYWGKTPKEAVINAGFSPLDNHY